MTLTGWSAEARPVFAAAGGDAAEKYGGGEAEQANEGTIGVHGPKRYQAMEERVDNEDPNA